MNLPLNLSIYDKDFLKLLSIIRRTDWYQYEMETKIINIYEVILAVYQAHMTYTYLHFSLYILHSLLIVMILSLLDEHNFLFLIPTTFYFCLLELIRLVRIKGLKAYFTDPFDLVNLTSNLMTIVLIVNNKV